jgi:hypothetical protein
MSSLMTWEHAGPDGIPADGANYDRRWWILGVLGIAQLVVVLDGTIVNIALPTAQRWTPSACGTSSAQAGRGRPESAPLLSRLGRRRGWNGHEDPLSTVELAFCGDLRGTYPKVEAAPSPLRHSA